MQGCYQGLCSRVIHGCRKEDSCTKDASTACSAHLHIDSYSTFKLGIDPDHTTVKNLPEAHCSNPPPHQPFINLVVWIYPKRERHVGDLALEWKGLPGKLQRSWITEAETCENQHGCSTFARVPQSAVASPSCHLSGVRPELSYAPQRERRFSFHNSPMRYMCPGHRTPLLGAGRENHQRF